MSWVRSRLSLLLAYLLHTLGNLLVVMRLQCLGLIKPCSFGLILTSLNCLGCGMNVLILGKLMWIRFKFVKLLDICNAKTELMEEKK